MKKIFYLFLTIFLLISSLKAAGESGGNAFDLLSGARQMALSSVFIAKADDVNSLIYNPAGLSNLNRYGIGLTYDNNIEDIKNAIVTFVAPTQIGCFGVAFAYSTIGNFNNSAIDEEISVYDIVSIIGYGYKIASNINLGGNVKYLNSKLGSYYAWAIAFDLGVLYEINNDFNLGFVAQNIGTSLKYDIEETQLPIKIGIGVNYSGVKLQQHRFNIGSDFKYNIIDKDFITGIGLEYIYNDLIAVRSGYSYEKDSINSFTFGIGAKIKMYELILKFDYAFVPKIWESSNMSTTHMLTLILEF